jgi:VanZ like protein/concanavalin A-like lectin/glucanase superfamily protein
MDEKSAMVMKKALGAICALLACGMFVAGLWPFNPVPRNEVSWLTDQNGLRFGDYATILSVGTFEVAELNQDSFCSFEIWLQPAFGYVSHSVTILAFYTPGNPLQFTLAQYLDHFFVRRDYRDKRGRLSTAEIDIEHAFRQVEPVLFTITSGPRGTSAYMNGVFVEDSRRFGLSCKDFSGQLVIGNSPLQYNTWQGKLLGVAIYDHQLTPETVSRHYAAWTQQGVPEDSKNEGVLALYSFGERSGRTIHNRIGPAPSLYIPDTFTVLHKRILTPPWAEFSADVSYLWDVLLNIAGFIPFGFFFCAYLACNRQWSRAAVVTIVIGGIISVTIEILQGFVPSRSSGITDVITNTIGTSLGAILWKWQPIKILVLTRLGGSDPRRCG